MVRPPIDPARREAAVNAPGVVVGLVLALAAVHVVRQALPERTDDWVLTVFSFWPARFDAGTGYGALVPGGLPADVWTFVTYALLHGSWAHLGINAIWLLAFGSPVAWRFGAVRFLLFSAACSVAGAALHLAFHLGALVPVVGASAAISGQMAAALRFIFQPGAPLGLFRVQGRSAFRVPAHGLREVLRDRRILLFVATWLGLNVLLGVGLGTIAGAGGEIAWQAHVGGFIAGLLLFPLFDPVRSPARG